MLPGPAPGSGSRSGWRVQFRRRALCAEGLGGRPPLLSPPVEAAAFAQLFLLLLAASRQARQMETERPWGGAVPGGTSPLGSCCVSVSSSGFPGLPAHTLQVLGRDSRAGGAGAGLPQQAPPPRAFPVLAQLLGGGCSLPPRLALPSGDEPVGGGAGLARGCLGTGLGLCPQGVRGDDGRPPSRHRPAGVGEAGAEAAPQQPVQAHCGGLAGSPHLGHRLCHLWHHGRWVDGLGRGGWGGIAPHPGGPVLFSRAESRAPGLAVVQFAGQVATLVLGTFVPSLPSDSLLGVIPSAGGEGGVQLVNEAE